MSIQYTFKTKVEDILYQILQQIKELNMSMFKGYYKPVLAQDTDAPLNSVYFSLTSNKLVYKDTLGTINDLY